jgi:hypothetical protein
MLLDKLINNFSVDTLQDFFREKISTFKSSEDNFDYLFEGNDEILNNYEKTAHNWRMYFLKVLRECPMTKFLIFCVYLYPYL